MPGITIYANDEIYFAFNQLSEEMQKQIKEKIVFLIQKEIKKGDNNVSEKD